MEMSGKNIIFEKSQQSRGKWSWIMQTAANWFFCISKY